MTNHLSRYSKIFPRHTREFTRTYTSTWKHDTGDIQKGSKEHFSFTALMSESTVIRGGQKEKIKKDKRKIQIVSRKRVQKRKKKTHSKGGGLQAG